MFCTDEITNFIGMRIKELRQSMDITQEELALNAEINRSYINQIENGKRNISIVTINKISNALGVSLNEFFSVEKNRKEWCHMD